MKKAIIYQMTRDAKCCGPSKSGSLAVTHDIGEKIGHCDKHRTQWRKKRIFFSDGAGAFAMVLLAMSAIIMPPAGCRSSLLDSWTLAWGRFPVSWNPEEQQWII